MVQNSAESTQSKEICQPIIQAECIMPVNQEPYSRRSKRLEGKSVEGMMLEDIEDSSSSNDEVTNESDSDVDSESENLALDEDWRGGETE